MVDAGRDHVYSHSDNDTTTRGHNTDEREEEDELDAEEDGDIQLGLLSRKPRAGKERASDSSDVEGLTTKQLAMGILAEVSLSTNGHTCSDSSYLYRLCQR